MNYSENVTSSSAKQSLARVFVYRRKNGEGPLFGLRMPDRIIATRRRKSLKWDKNNKRNEQNPVEGAIRPRSLRNRYHRYALAQDINQTNKACNWSFHNFTCSSTISPDDVERKAFRTRSQIRRSVTARNPFQVEEIPKSICAGGKVIYGNDELSYTQSDGNFFPYSLSMAQDILDIYLPGPMLKK